MMNNKLYFFIIFLIIGSFQHHLLAQDWMKYANSMGNTEKVRLSQSSFLDAYFHIYNREYDEALTSLEKSNSLHPNAAANYQMGNIFFEKEEYKKAIDFYQKSINEYKEKNYLPYIALAKAFYQDFQKNQAIKILESFSKKHSVDNNKINNLLFSYYLDNEQLDGLEKYLKILDEANSIDYKSHSTGLAEYYMEKGDVASAIRILSKLLEKYPFDIDLHLKQIELHIASGQIDALSRRVAAFSAKFPHDPHIPWVKAYQSILSGQSQVDPKALQATMQHARVGLQRKLHLLDTLVRGGVLSDSSYMLAICGAVHEAHSNEPLASVALADILYWQAMYAESLDMYRKAKPSEWPNIDTWERVLDCYDRTNHPDYLLASEDAMEFFPFQALVFKHTAKALQADNQHHTAIKMLDKGLGLTKNLHEKVEMLLLMGFSYQKLNQTTDSELSFSKAKALINDVKNQDNNELYGDLYFYQQKNDEAVRFWNQALNKVSDQLIKNRLKFKIKFIKK